MESNKTPDPLPSDPWEEDELSRRQVSSVAVSSPEGFVSRGAAHERIENAACLPCVCHFSTITV